MIEGLPEDIKSAYQLKLTHKMSPEKVMFGVLDTYDEEAEDLWKQKRTLLLEDAVTGALYKVLYDNWNFEEMSLSGYESDPETNMPITTEYDRYVNDAYKEAIERHKAAGEGIQKGKMCTLPVADGYATYEIVRVNKKTCRVEWRGYGCADRYFDRRWGYEATVPLHEAEMYLSHWIERLEEMKA